MVETKETLVDVGLPPDGRESWFVHTMRLYAKMISEGMHFAQASYRDGEWRCILGQRGKNCDGTVYSPELASALIHTLLEPVGQWCVYWGPPDHTVRPEADEWISKHQPPVFWIADRPIALSNMAGQAHPFFKAARSRQVIIVGPEHLQQLPHEVLGSFIHIRVPEARAEHVVDELCELVLEDIKPGDLVLFAAGMASCLLVHRLWPVIQGDSTLIDIGSLLDPYCGVFSRGVYRDRFWQRNVMPRNLR